MKRILSLILSVLIVVLPGYSVFAESAGAEIEFCVGDDTLIINGEPVQVEKPYVVGVGVTLVPVRVITEAFGAEVGWEGETKTVTIDYPDVSIVLRIGDQIAEVNGRSETLLSAPELSAGGFTMVPLRFISENFGADVSYENETGRIKVVKENSTGDSTLQTKVNNEYLGDSYYGWMIKNSPDFEISERSFGGNSIDFNYDANNYFNVDIMAYYKDYDFEKDFSDTKSMLAGFTLVKADKDTSNTNKKIYRIQARDKETFIDLKRIVTDKYIFSLFGSLENDKTDYKNSFAGIVETFDSRFEGDDIYDMSDVKDGFRRFTSEHLNISFDVFEDYVLLYDDSVNIFIFGKLTSEENNTGINFVVYSKDSVISAEALANEDYNHNKAAYNEDITTFDNGVVKKTYGDLNVYEYSYTIKSAFYTAWTKDVFFEKGDYVYNIALDFDMPQKKDVESLTATVLSSIELSEIDASDVGKLLRNKPGTEGTFVSTKLKNCSITLPNDYNENQAMNYVQYVNSVNGLVITAAQMTDKDGYTLSDTKNMARDLEKQNKTDENVNVVVSTTDYAVSTFKGYKHIMSIDDPEAKFREYVENYFIYNNKNESIYVFSVEYPETGYSNTAKKEISDILSSIVFK